MTAANAMTISKYSSQYVVYRQSTLSVLYGPRVVRMNQLRAHSRLVVCRTESVRLDLLSLCIQNDRQVECGCWELYMAHVKITFVM